MLELQSCLLCGSQSNFCICLMLEMSTVEAASSNNAWLYHSTCKTLLEDSEHIYNFYKENRNIQTCFCGHIHWNTNLFFSVANTYLIVFLSSSGHYSVLLSHSFSSVRQSLDPFSHLVLEWRTKATVSQSTPTCHRLHHGSQGWNPQLRKVWQNFTLGKLTDYWLGLSHQL